MNKERDSYYYILGLQPGASLGEIKSAFRRLVKLYHADHDQSLDAEMKYREIQAAYKELLKQPFTGNSGDKPDSPKRTARASENVAAQSSVESHESQQQKIYKRQRRTKIRAGVYLFAFLLLIMAFGGRSDSLFRGRFNPWEVISEYSHFIYIFSFAAAGIMFIMAHIGIICKKLAVRIAVFCPLTLAYLVLLLFGGSFLFIGRYGLLGLICVAISSFVLSLVDKEEDDEEIKERLTRYKKM